jgi:hypothetical protein
MMATVNRDKRDIAWTPDTLRERQGALVGHEEKTKPPGTSGSLAFPCKRADHLEVSCSERYPQQLRPSNGSDKFTFHWMWTTCGNGVYCNRMLCGSRWGSDRVKAKPMWKPVKQVV